MTSPSSTDTDALAARINAALPQTQCTRCGFPDCASYAQAIARGEAEINQCPPGGAEGVGRLAAITGRAAQALNPQNGQEQPRRLAVIDENWCIGCTLCAKACPTDAIVGIHKRMHTIIDEHCTGCELCVDACPVDCISMENVTGEASGWAAWSPELQAHALKRYQARQARETAPSMPLPTAQGTTAQEAQELHPIATDPGFVSHVTSPAVGTCATTGTTTRALSITDILAQARARQTLR